MSISDTTDGSLENKGHEKDGWVLTNQIKLSPKQADELFKFLTDEEDALILTASDENKDVREAYAMIVNLLIDNRKKKREWKERVDKKDSPTKKITPISLPKGEYFTIPQMAEICNVSIQLVMRWILKGDIGAVDLPGVGQIVAMEKFIQFLNQHKPSGS